MASLSIICPVLNEASFLPLYLDSATRYADEILFVDGGSTDGSLEIIADYQKQFNIRTYEMKQTGKPYTADWNESKVRNFLVSETTGDWVLKLDADEILADAARQDLPQLLQRGNFDLFAFPLINFWKDPWTQRVNAPGDARWDVNTIRLWRNGIGIHYNQAKTHCTLEWRDKPIWSLPYEVIRELPIYHYHYALGPRIKTNDNRRGDVNRYQNTGEPDWNYKHDKYEIRTQPFTGTHPRVIQEFLNAR
jgi:glycosyltransferase involved in cell wall biosynthesis